MKFKQQKDKFDHCEIASQRTAYIDVDGLLRNSTHTLSFEIEQNHTEETNLLCHLHNLRISKYLQGIEVAARAVFSRKEENFERETPKCRTFCKRESIKIYIQPYCNPF